jgi:LmbE family N-acetylglucosaminyl deacetylase
VATLVCFHAHPDDECIGTGGTIARASAEGHRVVLVVATNGDHGEFTEDVTTPEQLVVRRREETLASAAVLGVHRVEWLGYRDSGMTGWEQNTAPGAFCNASLDEAAHKLAAILKEENADILTTYDWHGGYGHPDHIMVHKVGHRAAELFPSVRVLEGTMNRDQIRRGIEAARAAGMMGPDEGFDVDGPADDGNPMGSLESEINIKVNVREFAMKKRDAMKCHASQLTDSSFFMQMPDERFVEQFGNEWFIEPGNDAPMRDGWIFE